MKLSAKPNLRPVAGTQARVNGQKYALYKAKLPPCQVVEAGRLPGR